MTQDNKDKLQNLYHQLLPAGQKLLTNPSQKNTTNYITIVEEIGTLMEQISKSITRTNTINFSDTIVFNNGNYYHQHKMYTNPVQE